jgi:hypothetical protein
MAGIKIKNLLRNAKISRGSMTRVQIAHLYLCNHRLHKYLIKRNPSHREQGNSPDQIKIYPVLA